MTVEIKASFDLLAKLDRLGYVRFMGSRGTVPKNAALNRKLGKDICERLLSDADERKRQWGTIELEIPLEVYERYCDVHYKDKSRQDDKVRDIVKDIVNNGRITI